ncbi:response regulator [Amycolatopsis sp. NPDC049868]|uniref:response regulator n=1 Tax=Amycolatopsis sp. NPDC049868 TaxID=3363934 RepID=UPI0037B2953C
MIKVVVADNEELVRAGICSILRASGRIEVVAETGNGQRVVELTRRHRPDVVVMDVPIAGLDGIRATRIVQRETPSSRVIIFTSIAVEECIYRSFSAGASGFLKKDVAPQELVEAVTSVASGNSILSPSITRCVIDKFLQFDRDLARLAQNRIEMLTAREHEVLAYLVQGLGNAEIARLLFVSEGAVKAHVSHMLTKLGCANRVQAAIVAHDSGLFPSRPVDATPDPARPGLGVAS